MTPSALYSRFAEARLVEALGHSPAVLLHGPRQCGKTTLARVAGERLGYRYLTFDDDRLRRAAAEDTVGFTESLPERVILDEAQRVPGLFGSLRREIDRRRTAGRFLLTGSPRALRVPRLEDLLAGRLRVARLHPLSRAEIERSTPGFLDALFGAGFPPFEDVPRLGPRLADLVTAGGYPTANDLPSGSLRRDWYADTAETVLSQAISDLARPAAREALPNLLTEAAARTAQLTNISALATRFSVSRQTIEAYTQLLERMFLVERLPPWASNRLARLVKTPKLHLGDTGLAAALLGVQAADLLRERTLLGALTETFVYQELRRQASGSPAPTRFFHCRDRDGVETDLLVVRGRRVAGIEVKAGATIHSSDFRGLKQLRRALGDDFVRGVLLYDGERALPFGDRLSAVPLTTLWRAPTEARAPAITEREVFALREETRNDSPGTNAESPATQGIGRTIE